MIFDIRNPLHLQRLTIGRAQTRRAWRQPFDESSVLNSCALAVRNAAMRHSKVVKRPLPQSKCSRTPIFETHSQFLTCRQTGNSKPLRVSQYRSDRSVHFSFLVPRSLYCWGNDSHPPPSALYKAIRFVVTAVWLCAKRSSFP